MTNFQRRFEVENGQQCPFAVQVWGFISNDIPLGGNSSVFGAGLTTPPKGLTEGLLYHSQLGCQRTLDVCGND